MSDSKPQLKYLDPQILQRIHSLDLIAREVVEGVRVGIHKSPLRGFSTEFAQHRQYVPGDSLRHLDWRVYARTGRYYVKMYEAETNFTGYLLLDASRSMHYSSGAGKARQPGFQTAGLSKLEYVKFMSASLAYLIVEQRDSAGLCVFTDKIQRYVEPKGSLSVVKTIAEELEKVEPQPRTDIAGMLHEFARRIPRRSFVILFSDLFDHVDQFLLGLEHLRFRGHNVTVFHTLDPYELEFPFQGTWKFKGLELEPEISTQPKRIRAAYLDELRKFIKKIRTACERSHVDYVLVNTAKPVDQVLTGYLVGRLRTAAR